MKIVACSDLHLDWVTCGKPRFEDGARVLRAAVARAIDDRADAFVFGGDLTDPDSSPGAVLRAIGEMMNAVDDLATNGVAAYLVVGNHDVVEDGTGTSTLTPLDPVAFVMGAPYFAIAKSTQMLFLPHVAQTHPSAARDEDVIERAAKWKDEPLIVVAHRTIPGMHPGTESGEAARGRSCLLPVDALRELAKVRPLTILSGHYHQRGRHDLGDGLVVNVIGAGARLTFGEEDNDPGYVVVEV